MAPLREPTQVGIRQAVAEDLAAIARIERAAFPQPWSEPLLGAHLGDPTQLMLVGSFGTHRAGYLLARLAPPEAEILKLAVEPRYRRRGCGRALLGAGLETLRQRGADDVHLEVRAENETAIRLYRRFGFEVRGSRRAYYFDGSDALLMARRGG